MKKSWSLIIILLILLCACLEKDAQKYGEENEKLGIEKIFAVEYHDSSHVFLLYRDKNGYYYKESIDSARIVTDGTFVVVASEYLSDSGESKQYGVLPGREEGYQKYLQAIQKK